MNKIVLSITITVLFILAACGSPGANSPNSPAPIAPTQAPQPSVPKNGNYNGKGKVTKINLDLGSVELNHEKIVDLMPAMQMEFYVKDKAMLSGLKLGDEVDFVLEYKNAAETIVEIKKNK